MNKYCNKCGHFVTNCHPAMNSFSSIKCPNCNYETQLQFLNDFGFKADPKDVTPKAKELNHE